MQRFLFDECEYRAVKPFKTQLLKWIGNKQRFADEIVGVFPGKFNKYYEPFLGSGAVLATLAPEIALGSDVFQPLIEIWEKLKTDPDELKKWYADRWIRANGEQKKDGYLEIRDSYNQTPNGADFLFLCRACYGGVVRFRKADGYMSTPCGVHEPIQPDSFNSRVDIWHKRIKSCEFERLHYKEAMKLASCGDLIYCDPPYHHSQSILYGGQEFKLHELFEEIECCKNRGVYVALSIDGAKKSGTELLELAIPSGLFEEEIYVNCGRSMLKRFQMEGKTLEDEMVSDRLLLTYPIRSKSELSIASQNEILHV